MGDLRLDNPDYKKRRLAGVPANSFIVGRVYYKGNRITKIVSIGSATRLSGIDRSIETETVSNGVTATTLPKNGSNKALTVTLDGNNPVILEWYTRCENKQSSYMSDLIILILDSGTNKFSRALGVRRAWLSTIAGPEIDSSTTTSTTDKKWQETVVIEHGGWRYIDPGDIVTIYDTFSEEDVDKNKEIEYNKDIDNFDCERDVFNQSYTRDYLL